MAGGVISPLYTGVKARQNGTPCITPAASTGTYVYMRHASSLSTRLLPLVTSDGAGTIHVSVYRKLRSGSVKSSALNGTGQTYAETWEIAARALCTYSSTRKTYKTLMATAVTRDSLLLVCLLVIYGKINRKKQKREDR